MVQPWLALGTLSVRPPHPATVAQRREALQRPGPGAERAAAARHPGKGRVLQPMDQAQSSQSKLAVIDGEEAKALRILVGGYTEAPLIATYREKLLAQAFANRSAKPTILILSDPNTSEGQLSSSQALAPLYEDLALVTSTIFDTTTPLITVNGDKFTMNRRFHDCFRPFATGLKNFDLVLMRRGLCYCHNGVACCGVSRLGRWDSQLLLEVGRALSNDPKACGLLAGAFMDFDAVGNGQTTYGSWVQAALDAMKADPALDVRVILDGKTFVGLKVTYNHAKAIPHEVPPVVINHVIKLDLTYDLYDLELEPFPMPSGESEVQKKLSSPTYVNSANVVKLNLDDDW
ncbi:MAG TPA: hypothetical protein VJV79_34200 [Polyangiaceae bacterium]|nr:hypothetical protein [Polyangiaceae bacterium]